MAEKRSGGYQPEFESLKEHDPLSTHTIFPGARIKVETKSGHGFAWTTVTGSEFDAILQPKNAEPHHEKRMRLFLAMTAFSAHYFQHEKTITYDGGTRLFAFPEPEDGTVIKITKRVAKK